MTLQVLAAGSNAHGQLANGTQDDSHTLQSCLFAFEDGSLQHELPGDSIVSIASGANHTLLLLEVLSTSNKRQTQLWGCGDNRHGQLGPGDLESSTGQNQTSVFRRIDRNLLNTFENVEKDTHIITAIAASWESSYFVLQARQGSIQSRRDVIYSMGNNDFQDLGVDISASKLKTLRGPHKVALEAALEGHVANGLQVMCIAAGPHQVVATIRLFSDDGADDVLVGWGACRHGQLGTNPKPLAKIQATCPRIISLPLMPPDGIRDTVISFAVGSHHTVLLHRSGWTTGLGSNKKGQLNELQANIGAKSVHCTWNGTYLVLENNSDVLEWEIRATGSSDKGQLGHTPNLTATGPVKFPFDHATRPLVGIACGSEHVLALLTVFDQNGSIDGREVWEWGWNEHGNLGLGHTTDVHSPTKLWPRGAEIGKGILGVWGGCGTSWIVVGP